MLYFRIVVLMYPVSVITHMLNILDSFNMGATFILPNTKQNMYTYHILNQRTSSTFLFLKLRSI